MRREASHNNRFVYEAESNLVEGLSGADHLFISTKALLDLISRSTSLTEPQSSNSRLQIYAVSDAENADAESRCGE